MTAPEDDPADEVQPTREEWEEYERQRAEQNAEGDTAEWVRPPELGGEG